MAKKILAFGELLWDMLPEQRLLGGAPANFIFRVNELGDKGVLVSRLGHDSLGREARKMTQQLGISDKYIQIDPNLPTGTVEVRLDEFGKPDFSIAANVAYDFIDVEKALLMEASAADCIYYGTLIQRNDASRDALVRLLRNSPQALTFCDINLRRDCYSDATVINALEFANVLKINDEELEVLQRIIGLDGGELKEAAENLCDAYGLAIVVVTLGEKGAFCLNRDKVFHYVHGHEVDVVDTIGCGDAFSAGFIHELLQSGDMIKALRCGNALGALTATTQGATTPISAKALNDYLMKQPAH